MGTICGPTLANTVVYHLERKWLTLNRPIIYWRYIDDIFIVSQNLINLEDFKSSFLNLKLKTANHPYSIFKIKPISILIRIRRICSDYTDFLHFSRLILYQLLCRGYQFGYLCKAIDSIGKIKRESLIPYKTKIKSFNLNNKVIFNSKFDLNLTDERKIFYSIWDKLDFKDKINKDLFIVNSVNYNFKKIFIHEFKYFNNTFFINIVKQLNAIIVNTVRPRYNGSFGRLKKIR